MESGYVIYNKDIVVNSDNFDDPITHEGNGRIFTTNKLVYATVKLNTGRNIVPLYPFKGDEESGYVGAVYAETALLKIAATVVGNDVIFYVSV